MQKREDEDDHQDHQMQQVHQSQQSVTSRIDAPVLQGWALAIVGSVIETFGFVSRSIATNAKILTLRDFQVSNKEHRGDAERDIHLFPMSAVPLPEESWFEQQQPHWNYLLSTTSVTLKDLFMAAKSESSADKKQNHFVGFYDYHAAYLGKTVSVSEVLERILATIDATHSRNDGTSPDHLHHVYQCNKEDVLRQAKQSDARYDSGNPLSPLDGVPILVKDETDVEGYETRCGTSFLNKGNPAKEDCEVVSRLRGCGAIIIGKASMDEWGWQVFGINPNTGTARNPHDLNRSCGGSSGGSSGAVSAGFCPISIGCDGGGSIRIPASFCGVFGLKPTTGRISSRGGYPLAQTVGVTGPIAASSWDLAAAYLVMGGKDFKAESTLRQPPVYIPRNFLTGPSMKGVRIGIMPAYAAQVTDPVITKVMSAVQAKLVEQGAILVPVNIPYLDEIKVAHIIAISSEMMSVLHSVPDRYKLIWQNRVNMAACQHLSSADYVIANKFRTHLIRTLVRIFTNVSYILLPTTAVVAPKLPNPPRVLNIGSSNIPLVSDATRFSFVANLSGCPAVTVPVAAPFDNVVGGTAGETEPRMPVGVQFMASWYEEGKLLEAAKWMEDRFETGVCAKHWVGSFLS